MADISKIKLPNGSEYSLKDSWGRTNHVSKTDELMTTNIFAPAVKRGPYISKIDNAFYAADKRWTVTATNISGGISTLFDGNYESCIQIGDGQTAVITMDFESTTYFPGYPYGNILVSVYYVARPANITCRAYCNYEPHGIGWFDIPMTMISDSNSQTVYQGRNGRYRISKIEFTITGQMTSGYNTSINQIEMHLDRPDSSRNPFLTKYSAETLYYPLTAPKFIGDVTGNVSGTAANITGTVAVEHGGTGQTTARNAANAFMNALEGGSSVPVDADYYISQYVGGGTTTTTYHRRPMSALWSYIKGKIESIVLSSSTHSTSTTTAATSSAVKEAYDLADTANTASVQLAEQLDQALVFNTTYEITGSTATFTAKVYNCGDDVTSDFSAACFTWWKRTSEGMTQYQTTGPTFAVNVSTLGYGATILARFNSEGGNT